MYNDSRVTSRVKKIFYICKFVNKGDKEEKKERERKDRKENIQDEKRE